MLEGSTASVSSIHAATGTWQGQIMLEAALGKYQGLLRMGAAQISLATFSGFASSFSLLIAHQVLAGREKGSGSRSVSRLVPGVEQMFWDLSGLVCTWLWQGFGCLAGFKASWAVTKPVHFLPLSSH